METDYSPIMTFSRFQEAADTPTDDDSERIFPRMHPVEGGEVTFRGRIRGNLHLLEDEGALAFVREKEFRFNKYNGYGISVEILEDIEAVAADLRESGAVDDDVEAEYIFLLIEDTREILQFTMDQYWEAEHDHMNTWGVSRPDPQHIVEEDDAIRTWPDGYRHIFKDDEFIFGFSSVE